MNDALRGKVGEGRSCARTGVEAAGEVERGSGRLVGRATAIVEILLYQWRDKVTKILARWPQAHSIL